MRGRSPAGGSFYGRAQISGLVSIALVFLAAACGSDGSIGRNGSRSIADGGSAPADGGYTPVLGPWPLNIDPRQDVLGPNGVRVFWADIAVHWSVQEADGGAISDGGTYVAPGRTGTFHVVARNASDAGDSLTAEVDVVASGFTPAGNLNVARDGQTSTLLPDGTVLIAGGDNGGTGEVFDPVTATFTVTGNMTSPRSEASATLLADGRVLLAGGIIVTQPNPTYLASAEIYDPSTRAFTLVKPMAHTRAGHTATLLPDGRVLIAGGEPQDTYDAGTAEVYDPVTGGFASLGVFSLGDFGSTATRLGDGRVVLIGDIDIDVFDPATMSFATVASMTTRREGHTATLLADGRVLITGGFGGGMHDSTEIYDPSDGTLTPSGSMMVAREFHTGTLLPDGKVLIAGGDYCDVDDCGPIFWSAEVYDPQTGTFTQTGSMENARTGHTATLVAGTKVLVIGYATQGAEIYK